MKKLFILSMAVICFMACDQKEERYFSESDEINAVKAGIAAYEAGDWDTWKSHFADTAKIYVNSTKGITVDERVAGLQATAGALSSYGFDHENEFIEMVKDKDDETWVYYWATHNAKIAENNKDLSVPVHLAMHIEDGKIVEEYVYFDGTQFNAELGASANMTENDKAIMENIEQFIEVFLNKQDNSVLDNIVASDYTRYMNDVKVATGPKELAASMAPFFAGFKDFTIAILHKSPLQNNHTFLHWQMTGTNTGEFAGVAATGKEVKVTGLSRLEFNDEGQLIEEYVFYDRLNLMEQLGRKLNP